MSIQSAGEAVPETISRTELVRQFIESGSLYDGTHVLTGHSEPQNVREYLSGATLGESADVEDQLMGIIDFLLHEVSDGLEPHYLGYTADNLEWLAKALRKVEDAVEATLLEQLHEGYFAPDDEGARFHPLELAPA